MDDVASIICETVRRGMDALALAVEYGKAEAADMIREQASKL